MVTNSQKRRFFHKESPLLYSILSQKQTIPIGNEPLGCTFCLEKYKKVKFYLDNKIKVARFVAQLRQ